ncbi:MAG: peroxiredoxin [Cytophagales bacterium]
MALQVGDKAPMFSGTTQTGDVISLATFRGKKLALYFYPKDNTPGCTKQACNLRDHEAALQAAGYHIVGISNDSVASHQRFATKYNLAFPLIADQDKEITKAYGTQRMLWFPRRTTFIIDEEGYITHIFKKVDTKAHAQQILKISAP